METNRRARLAITRCPSGAELTDSIFYRRIDQRERTRSEIFLEVDRHAADCPLVRS